MKVPGPPLHFYLPRAFSAENIIIYGLSLGGVPALELASTQPIKKLILECAFTDMHQMARYLFPYIPVPVRLLVQNKYFNQEKIKRCPCPVLILQGALDKTVAPKMAEVLYKNHPGKKTDRPCPGCGTCEHHAYNGGLVPEDHSRVSLR